MAGPDLDTIVKLIVPVIVHIGENDIPFEDVLALVPGAIIELHKSAEDELDLRINNKPIGTGQVVKVGENFGIRISSVNTPHQRVEAMGQ